MPWAKRIPARRATNRASDDRMATAVTAALCYTRT
jgi:hypothetical protein